MKKTKKVAKKTKKLVKKADFLTLAASIRANRQRAQSEEDLRISSLTKSLAKAMAQGTAAGRQEAGAVSYELAREQLRRLHRTGQV